MKTFGDRPGRPPVPASQTGKQQLVVKLDDIGDFRQQVQRNAVVGRAVFQGRLQTGPGLRDEFVAVLLLMQVGGEEPEVAMGDSEAVVAFVDAPLAEDDCLVAEGEGVADGGPFFEGDVALGWEHVFCSLTL